MDVQAADALGGVAEGQVSMHPSREVRPLGIACRKMAHGGEDFAVVVAGGKGVEDFVNACDGCRHAGPANCQRFGHEKRLFFLRLLFAYRFVQSDRLCQIQDEIEHAVQVIQVQKYPIS